MEEQTRFIVFTAGFNSEKWVRKNILSIKKQSYENYIHIVVDDATTDRTEEIIDKYEHPKLVSYRNNKNKKWIYNSITYLPENIQSDEDVIVIVDMDDWLAQQDVLKKLNKIYMEKKAWITYGSFVSVGSSKRTSTPRRTKYSAETIRNKTYRKEKWFFWHPRTFKVFLWNNVDREHMKAPDGKWSPYTYDKAIGLPMLEMCPPEKIVNCKEVFYVYNRGNPHASSGIKRRGGGHGGHFRKFPVYDELVRP